MRERLTVDVTPDLLAAVDEYRFTARQKSRSDAARRLLEAGLRSVAAGSAKEQPQTHPEPE